MKNNPESSYTDMPGTIESQRVFYLDFIRAISICSIIIFHFNCHAMEFQIIDNAILGKQWGYELFSGLGVSLFIVLSGSSLMLSSRANFEIKTYLRKRVFSIYPLFWTTYITIFLTLLLIQRKLPVKAPPLTFLLTIIGFDGFFLYKADNFYIIGEWFLGFIIIMYFVFPLLRYLFLRYNLFTLLLCILVTLLSVSLYNFKMEISRFPLSRLAEFIFGMSFIFLFKPSQKWLNLLLAFICARLFLFAPNLNFPNPLNMAILGISAFSCLACLSLLFDNVIFRKSIGFLSAYSYGAFLIHHIFLIKVLLPVKNCHVTLIESYVLFFMVLAMIYALSFLLTNATSFAVEKIKAKDI